MSHLDYWLSQKGQEDAASAVNLAERLRETARAEVLHPVGEGWFVQPKDGDWTRIQFSEEPYVVFYQQGLGGYTISDQGSGIRQLLKRSGVTVDDTRLKQQLSRLAAQFSGVGIEGESVCGRQIIGEMLADMICRALAVTYSVANMRL